MDRLLNIAAAGSRKSTKWSVQQIYWSELIERLKSPVKGKESFAQYLKLSKSKQDDLKDVGGFVGGAFKDNRRKASNVLYREIITLDLDNIPSTDLEMLLNRISGLGCAYAIYSTRKHIKNQPRIRVIIPQDRQCTPDEYEAAARKTAELIGIEYCDPTTFQPSRLMYWPSVCSDGEYLFLHSDMETPFVSVDGLLGMYENWKDYTKWPQVPGYAKQMKKLAEKQADPITKNGIVGAFCKVYSIQGAIEKFLPDVYYSCDTVEDRYTYSKGSTTGGAIAYDNKFLYSHHATDPACSTLCNSFDLVRVHLFGEQDDDAKEGTPTNKLPSFIAMCELATADKSVVKLMHEERYQEAMEDFTKGGEILSDDDTNWKEKLKTNKSTGNYLKTIENVLVILENDPLIKGKLGFDEFANRMLSLGALPWDEREEKRAWNDSDDAGLRFYIEKVYGITGKDRINDGLVLCATKNRFNDVVKFLRELSWDGVPRLDTWIRDYLGCDDNAYTRAVARKCLVAAVARALTPGCKFDIMTILVGLQGIGKSTAIRLLGKLWFSDSLNTFEGKDAAEMIQGTWINELGELAGLKRSEVNSIKQFLSKTEDIYRAPYGRNTAKYPRRCVFFGTTNDHEFLKDYTGNRRFWPVDVGKVEPKKSVFDDLEKEVDQIWAEAVMRFTLGEPLYLTGEAEELAQIQQESHRESSAKEGLIREFLEKPIPQDWLKRDLSKRRMWWSGEFQAKDIETTERDRVCAAEIWCECFGGDIKYFKKMDAVEINGILARIEGYERVEKTQRFGIYGPQRGFLKV